ncbi:hypothetical protein EMIHUDRAFT_218125 [Emiliania huxleyi CCMP1516]|uniref:Methyltransferase FkbM domain-containing protein n=2 Tax=Emiliania huxleyi TaxID=2903 RepID=A0A0D3I8Q6_EMIH1|nr:hypothetical protein EMIHUDRAFT_218125 [Emiliania huxleyi CCMP1516]EOD07641.1 hypothetical protein EMIHUDRAFT_218125 [Emiliania huxleyi CCMP1516]|eukprot:XP_005760070.1 hypothetical protein EMIHUDRAFT_218125 [Emiliania huxleyi CCMP1516]
MVSVPCQPLSSLMAAAGLPSVDVLSLDVQGAELKVLSTVDAARAFKFVVVEADKRFPDKIEAVRTLLTASNFRRMQHFETKSDLNHVYAHESVWEAGCVDREKATQAGIWYMQQGLESDGRSAESASTKDHLAHAASWSTTKGALA